MLTVEMLSQSPALQGLTDAQKQVIATMSQNDENTVIGTRIGELHGQYDQDVLGITGIAKNVGEKSYDYVKRVLNSYKTKVDSHKAVKAELEAAKTQVTELQAKLEKNAGDETLKQQLKDAKAQVTQLQSTLQAKETEFTTKKAELEAEARNIHIDYAFQAAVSGLKFKDGITEPVQRVLLQSAKNEVLAKGTPDFVDDGNGGKKLVLRDANGIIINNPKNNLNPYTMQELVMETSLKDVIDAGRQQPGGGTIPPTGGAGGAGGTLDMSGIKTQLEADKAISAHLLANGLTRDSKEFAEQSMQLRNENNVAQLPIR
jgi:hypothetical protein